MGGNSVSGEWYRGLLDDLRFYNRALTKARLQTDMTAPLPQRRRRASCSPRRHRETDPAANERFERDAHAVHHRGHSSEVLAGVTDAARDEHRPQGRTRCRGAADVNAACAGLVANIPPVVAEPAAEVGLLAVEK